MHRIASAVALAAMFTAPAFADQTEGVVTKFDARTGVLVMQDRTVWVLPADALPDGLAFGAQIRIEFDGLGENGAQPRTVVLLAPASSEPDA